MINVFSGLTADDVWRQAMNAFRGNGSSSLQQSRVGPMHEILHATLHIENPTERWVASRSPVLNPAFAIAELFWILAGDNEATFVNFWNPALPKYAGTTTEYYGAYGFRLKKRFSFDQMEQAYSVLTSNPNTRQVVLQIWDPVTDFPHADGTPKADDIPCNICSLLKVRNGQLEWLQIMRSNDLFRGTPYNFIQFTTLQEIIAGWLSLEVGSYCHIADSLHVYASDLEELADRPVADFCSLRNVDDLRLPKDVWDKVFSETYAYLKMLSSSGLTAASFMEIINSKSLPKSYANLLLITAADSARRRGWRDLMDEAAALCSNNQLSLLWENWKSRSLS